MELEGKLALVTGASRGIGFACVEALLAEGARVAMVSRDPARLEAAAAGLGGGDAVLYAAADTSDPASARRGYDSIVARAGVPDVLICSAGAAAFHDPLTIASDDWRKAWDAKFLAVMTMIDCAKPDMIARGSGVIVPIIGTGGKVAQTAHLCGGAANAALMLATVGLGVALAPKGVRVVGLNPAATATDRAVSARQDYARILGVTVDELTRQYARTFPMGRSASPREIAEVAIFLASARAAYLAGTIVNVDGGQTPAL
nr:SDR family oxidoreductase [Sphingobium sp. JAI105]